ncbi:hypothetical protein BCEN4_1330026 [Burkholderia cenocepacia]|nr:hypothetical protein BCEN4_1330026 [Burkholderia cenocepacia]
MRSGWPSMRTRAACRAGWRSTRRAGMCFICRRFTCARRGTRCGRWRGLRRNVSPRRHDDETMTHDDRRLSDRRVRLQRRAAEATTTQDRDGRAGEAVITQSAGGFSAHHSFPHAPRLGVRLLSSRHRQPAIWPNRHAPSRMKE